MRRAVTIRSAYSGWTMRMPMSRKGSMPSQAPRPTVQPLDVVFELTGTCSLESVEGSLPSIDFYSIDG